MQNGDVAGLAALRDSTAWIGIKKENDIARVVVADKITMNTQWQTTATGREVASQIISGTKNSDTKIWLRIDADIRTTDDGGTATFYYSTDGKKFTPLGETFKMKREWNYFLGYRFGIFNYATQSLGGSVKVNSFKVEKQL